MAEIKNLYDTSLPENYAKGLFQDKYYDIGEEHTHKFFDILFNGTAYALNSVKSKEKPAVFEFRTLDKKFVAASIVRFFENEDTTKPGNWNLVWTFDEADLPDDRNVITLDDSQAKPFFVSVAGDKYGIRFNTPDALVNMLIYLLEQLKKWLDENAKADEVVSVGYEGLFQARVAVENGEKVFALEVDGEIKLLIKDDAAIEK